MGIDTYSDACCFDIVIVELNYQSILQLYTVKRFHYLCHSSMQFHAIRLISCMETERNSRMVWRIELHGTAYCVGSWLGFKTEKLVNFIISAQNT